MCYTLYTIHQILSICSISTDTTDSLKHISLKKKQKQIAKKQKKKLLQYSISNSDSDSDDESQQSNNGDSNEQVYDQTVTHEHQSDTQSHVDEHTTDVVTSDEIIDFTDIDNVIAYRQKYGIHIVSNNDDVDVESDTLYYPVTQFSQLTTLHNVDNNIVTHCTTQYNKPSIIQQQCWPIILNKHDVIGIAHTGSGKTLTYLLPIYQYIYNQRHTNNNISQQTNTIVHKPVALILAPTRELVLQITQVAQSIQSTLNIVTHNIIGGPDIQHQLTYLHTNPADIYVATLGRLKKLLQDTEQPLSLSTIQILVLDECDRILDLGFESDLLYIVSQLQQQRQTLLFSATFPKHIEHTAMKVFTNYNNVIRVHIGHVSQYNSNTIETDLPQANKNVTQIIDVIDRKNGTRERKLIDLITQWNNESHNTNKYIIFTLYKRESSDVCDYLNRKGLHSISISGDKTQTQRTHIMQQYRDNECNILVATDVAARGIDISDITHVINFSVGLSIEHYIHRIGRCGRADRTGVAYTFFVDYDLMLAPQLVQILRATQQRVSDELMEMCHRAQRKAAKHAGDIQVTGDARYVHNDDDNKDDNSDEDDEDAKYLVQQPKKQHAIHSKGRKGRFNRKH